MRDAKKTLRLVYGLLILLFAAATAYLITDYIRYVVQVPPVLSEHTLTLRDALGALSHRVFLVRSAPLLHPVGH